MSKCAFLNYKLIFEITTPSSIAMTYLDADSY